MMISSLPTLFLESPCFERLYVDNWCKMISDSMSMLWCDSNLFAWWWATVCFVMFAYRNDLRWIEMNWYEFTFLYLIWPFDEILTLSRLSVEHFLWKWITNDTICWMAHIYTLQFSRMLMLIILHFVLYAVNGKRSVHFMVCLYCTCFDICSKCDASLCCSQLSISLQMICKRRWKLSLVICILLIFVIWNDEHSFYSYLINFDGFSILVRLIWNKIDSFSDLYIPIRSLIVFLFVCIQKLLDITGSQLVRFTFSVFWPFVWWNINPFAPEHGLNCANELKTI